MIEASATSAFITGKSTQQAHQSILSRCDSLDTRTFDQHDFVSRIRHILITTFTFTEASIDAIFDLFPPKVVCETSCLKLKILFVIFRDILKLVGINVEHQRGLYIPQAIVNSVYESDNGLRNPASSLISEFEFTNAHSSSTSPGLQVESHNRTNGESESFWRRVDNTNRRFSDRERYSGILAESPNLAEIRKPYTTYCNQRTFHDQIV